MTVAADLIRRVEELGARISAHEDGVHLRIAPASALSPELLEDLRRHKAEVLQCLAPAPRRPWPGTWHGWCAAFRHELARLLAEGMDFDEAEDQAVRNLPEPPPVSTGVH